MIDLSLIYTLVKNVNKETINKNGSVKGVHSLYNDTVDLCESISYHSKKGLFPKKLFLHRSPNQTEKEANYIEKNYKQYTLPVFIDYINTITRPLADSNWSITYKEEKEAFKQSKTTFKEYVETQIDVYGSVENYVKNILPTIKSVDANGFIGIRPSKIDYYENELGELVVKPDELTKPSIFYYESKNVIDVNEDYILFLSNDKTKVGNIYELYTKDSIYFFKQQGKKQDNDFLIEEYYKHDLGYIPAVQLMGNPTISGNKVLWLSPFSYVTDILDIVLTNSNWLQASINKCVYPLTVMYGDPCTFMVDGIHCDGGHLHGVDYIKTCPSCNGSGLRSRISALGTLLIAPKKISSEGDTGLSQKPLEYVSPEVQTLEFLDKKIQSDTKKAEAILHLHVSNSRVNGSTEMTATGMVIDSKTMTSFIRPISDQIFYIYEFILRCIGEMRYGENFEMPELIKPKYFDFKTTEDYLYDLDQSIKMGMPLPIIQIKMIDYINSLYSDSYVTNESFRIITSIDRLFGMSNDEILTKLSRGTIDKWEDVLHSSILVFIDEALRENDKFLTLDFYKQKEILVNKAKSKLDEIGVDSDNDFIPDEPKIEE